MKKILLVALFLHAGINLNGQNYSERMAASIMQTHSDSITVKAGKPAGWDYEQGLLLKSLEKMYQRTGDAKYFNYIKKNIDSFVDEQGNIRTYHYNEFNSDNITTGRMLLYLYQELGDIRYKKAADILRKQIAEQPRDSDGGFWHKQRYPNQMWLDGLYMLEPFYAEFGTITGEDNWSDIVKQFELMYAGAKDAKTGLLIHAYDQARVQPWADKKTGHSPNFWGRSMGWYAMALVDVLDYMPANHPSRAKLIKQLQSLSAALVKVQDAKTGLWYQIPNFPGRTGNYLEASAANMFIYAFAKGARKGYLPASYVKAAQKAFKGVLENFISTDANGKIHLEKTVSVGGLGGIPYRDGSYAYYLSEPLRQDDLKGVGPFILASLEIEIAKELIGKGKKVVLDYFFNHEMKNGQRFHYTWEDRKDSGFHLWGIQFEQLGAKLDTLGSSPTRANLKDASVYIIVDPDSKKETAHPNYMNARAADEIEAWVKEGGNLILLANDTTNCEITQFNVLARRFGIEFVPPNLNFVQGRNWDQGTVLIEPGHAIFDPIKKVYIKEITSLNLSGPAKSIAKIGNNSVMALSKVGKGKVFALGDPWLYNEYTNNRRTPLEYENFQAAKKLAEFMLKD
jgi:unsaturated rhamnogalacturonyl hydrolase